MHYNNNIISNVPAEAYATNLCQYTEEHLANMDHSSCITKWKLRSLTTVFLFFAFAKKCIVLKDKLFVQPGIPPPSLDHARSFLYFVYISL